MSNPNLELELQMFKSRIQAVKNELAALPRLGPTSKKECTMIDGMLDDVEALGIQTISRRRLKHG